MLELGAGLTVITGETGAGKTMLVTALGLLLGGRADTGAVRTGATRRPRRGSRPRRTRHWVQIADEHGGEVESGQLLLGRQVSAEGRSRAFLGGASVPASALSARGRGAGRRARPVRPAPAAAARGAARRARRVRRRRGRRRAGALPRRASPGCGRWRPSCARCSGQRASGPARPTCCGSGLEEIEAVDPQPGEEQSLATEESRLGLRRHAADRGRDRPRGAVVRRRTRPTPSEPVAAARRALESVREHDPEVAALADRVAEVSYLLADVAADVASYATGVETDPARLAAVSERRAALTALDPQVRRDGRRGPRVGAQASAQRLLDLDGSDERVGRAARRARGAAPDPGRGGRRRCPRLRPQAGGPAGRGGHRRAARAVDAARPVRRAPRPGRGRPTGSRSTAAGWRVHRQRGRRGRAAAGRQHRLRAAAADQGRLRRRAVPGDARHRGGARRHPARCPRSSSTRSTPASAARRRSRSAGGWPRWPGRPRCWSSRTCRRSPRSPTGTSSCARAATARSPPPASTALDDAGRVQELSRMLAGLEESDTAMAHAQELLEVARTSGQRPERGVASRRPGSR